VTRKVLFLCLLLIFLAPKLSHADDWSGIVIGIADGDTITVMHGKQPVKVRLYGIDCPEQGQAFAKRAKQFTSKMAYRKTAHVEGITTDRYSRIVGMVLVDGLNLNEELIRVGLAWVYTRYCDRPICQKWKRLESEAREAKRGLWRDTNPIPPWEFRRKKRK
jgi:endonuclease YncB( thermonuclease family)